MSRIFQITCATCGKTITSEHIYGSIIYCDGCQSYKVLTNNRSVLKPVFYKIQRFCHDERFYREQILEFLCRNGKPDIFDRMRVTEPLRRYYVPVREICYQTGHFYIPLHEEHNDIFQELFPGNRLVTSSYNQALREELVADMNTTDYRPLYIQEESERIEFLPIDVPIEKTDALYGVSSSEMLIVKYLPVFTLGTNLGKLVCTGTDEAIAVVNWKDFDVHYVGQKESLGKRIVWRLGQLGVAAGFLTVLGAIGFGIYKVFTIGISSFGSFLMGILKVIGFALFAIIVAIEAGLLLAGLFAIVAPIPIFLFCLFYSEPKQKYPDRKKGRKVLRLN